MVILLVARYPTLLNIIDKFPFAADANATDVGDLTVSRQCCVVKVHNHGYTSGGAGPSKYVIDKFPFSSDANATDVGDLTSVADIACGSKFIVTDLVILLVAQSRSTMSSTSFLSRQTLTQQM